MRWCLVALLSGAGMGLGCSEDSLQTVQPRVEVEPGMLDYGDGCVDADNVLPLTISNRGAGVLELEAVRISAGADVFSASLEPVDLQITESVELPVVFVPTEPEASYQGTLVLVSNDPNEPELEIPLTGRGGIRDMEVAPSAVDFGIVNEGLAPTRTVEIRNLGGDPLIVHALTWTSTSADLGPLDLPQLPLTIPAKTSTAVLIEYRPADLGADSGTLRIESNDPDEPDAEVEVVGRANLAPVARAWICEKVPGVLGCPADTRYPQISAGANVDLGLDGRDTVDPEGGELSFDWEIVEQPDGQRPTLFFSTEDRAAGKVTGEVTVPRVGRYVLRLVARDDRGLESFDTPESRVAVQPKDLEIYLRWDLVTDADLHLVRPGGRPGDYGNGFAGTSTGSDCSAFNRTPNWGDPDRADDDPSLERDVVSGRGPEVIGLDHLEDGVYRAFVHYCDSRNVNTNIYAHIEVFVRGESVARLPVMDGARMLPGELWEAARIEWDPMRETAIVSEGTALVEHRPQLCILE